GNGTTKDSLSGGLVGFAEQPDQWRKVVANRELARNAADEILRWYSTVISFGRTAKVDTTIRDQQIRAGDFVTMLYISANRDEYIWERPDELDVTREPNPQMVAFGTGEHYCLGVNVAILEIRVVLEELAERYSGWESAGPVGHRPSPMFRSIRSLPLV